VAIDLENNAVWDFIFAHILTGFWAEAFFIPAFGFFVLYVSLFGVKKAVNISSETFDSILKNITLLLINAVLGTLIISKLAVFIQMQASQVINIPFSEFWSSMPWLVVLIIALLATDFVGYWCHRILHTSPMWAMHVIHHSDRHMTWTTSYRIHMFETVFMVICAASTLGLLGFPPTVAAVAAFIGSAYNKYIHCQLGWAHGFLRHWLISPNSHRWHHAEHSEAYNKNFGDIFTLWDRLFGTYYNPGYCDADIGVEDGPETLSDILIYPITHWYKQYFGREKSIELSN